MRTSNARVTARMRRTENGQVLSEYIVDGVAYGSIDAVNAVLGGA